MKTNKLLLRSIGILMLVLTFMLVNNKAWAQTTYTWTGADDGVTWADQGNWDQLNGNYPGQSSSDIVVIAYVNGTTPQFDVTVTVAAMTVASGATLYNDGASTLTVSGNTFIDASGTIDLADAAYPIGGGTPDMIFGGNITGSGSLLLYGDNSGDDQVIQIGGNLSVSSINPHVFGQMTGSLIEFNGSGTQVVSVAYTLDNVTIDASSVLSVTGTNLNIDFILEIDGEILPGSSTTIQGGGGSFTPTLQGSGKLDVTFTGGSNDFTLQYYQSSTAGSPSTIFSTVTLTSLTMQLLGSGAQEINGSISPSAFLINNSGGAVTFGANETANITVSSGSTFIVAAGSTFSGYLSGTGTIVVTDITASADNLTTQYTAGPTHIANTLTIEYAGTGGAQQLTSAFNPANFIIANTTNPVTFTVNEAPTTGTTVLAGAELMVSAGHTLSGTLTGPVSGSGTVDVTDVTGGSTDNLKHQYTGTITFTHLTINYAGSGTGQFIYTTEAFNGLTITNTSGVTAEVNITVNGTFTIGGSASFIPASSSINIDGVSGSGTITGTGTIYVIAAGNSDDFTTQYSNFTYAITTATTAFDGASGQNINTSVNFGNIALSSSVTLTGSGTVNIAGSVTNPGVGTFSFGTVSVVYDGGTGVTQSIIPLTVANLTVAGSGTSLTVNLGTGTVAGTIYVNTNSGAVSTGVYMEGTLTSNGAVTIGQNGSIKTNGSNTFNITAGGITGAGSLDCATNGGTPVINVVGDWTLHGFSQGTTGSTVVFKTAGAQNLNPGTNITFENLTIGSGGSNTTLTVEPLSVEVDETLTGDAGSTLDVGNAGSATNELLALYGDVTNPGGTFVINQGSGRGTPGSVGGGGVTAFLGTSVQHCANFTFFDVYVNKTGGGVTLTGNVTINDNLDFGNDGGSGNNITIGNYNLTLASGASHVGQYSTSPPSSNTFAANVTVGRATITNAYDGSRGYVIQNNGFSGGYFTQPVDNNGEFFPVGDDYAPILLTSGSGTPTQTGVRVSFSLVDDNGTTVTTHAVNATWDVNPVGSETFTATTQWGTTDELTSFDRTHTYLSYRLIDETSAHPWVPFTSTAGSAASAAGTSNGFGGGGAGGEWSFSSGASTTATFAAGTDNYIAIGDDASTALPVSLLTFGAQYQDGHVNLNWTTASEQNNAYFEVERSTDAANWTSIGQVPGHGTSNVLNTYMDIDNLAGVVPTGTLYYRLKQVDFNGNYTYSMIRSVDLNNPGPALAMYPNPTSNTLNVNWTSTTDDNSVLRLVNMSGVNVYSQTVSGKGMIQRQIDMSTLPSGVYYLQVISGNGSTVNQPVFKN